MSPQTRGNPDPGSVPEEFRKDDLVATSGAEVVAAEDVGPAVLPRQRSGPGRVLSILSGKAGTGKSTISANLACAIARDHGLTTAIMDLSLQFGDQALMFDAGPTPSLVDVLVNIDALTNDFVLDCMHDASGVRVLAAPPSPELADMVQPDHLRLILSHLRSMFDFVVLDISSHFDDITLEAVETSDALVLVTTPYLASVKDTKLLLKILSDLGVPARKLTCILNRLEPGLKMSLEVLEANLKFPLTVELPHASNALLESVTDGVPLAARKPGSEYGQKIKELAAMVVTVEGSGERKQRRNFLGLGR